MATDELFHVRTGKYTNDTDLVDILYNICPLYGWTVSEYTQGTSLTVSNGEIVYSFSFVDSVYNSSVKLLVYKAETTDGNLISDFQSPNYYNAGDFNQFYTLKRYVLAVNNYNISLNYYLYVDYYSDSYTYFKGNVVLGINLLKYNTMEDYDTLYIGTMGYCYSQPVSGGSAFIFSNPLGFLVENCVYVNIWNQTPSVKKGSFVYFNGRILTTSDLKNFVKTSSHKLGSCAIYICNYADTIGTYVDYRNIINKLTYSFSSIKQKQIIFLVDYDYLSDGNTYTFPIGYSPVFGVNFDKFNGVVNIGTDKYYILNNIVSNYKHDNYDNYDFILRLYGVGYKLYDYLEVDYVV